MKAVMGATLNKREMAPSLGKEPERPFPGKYQWNPSEAIVRSHKTARAQSGEGGIFV